MTMPNEKEAAYTLGEGPRLPAIDENAGPIAKQENLGQVLTSDTVAELMVNLLTLNLQGNLILDPCVGTNVFFRKLEEYELDTRGTYVKVGIEIDPRIVPREWFSDEPNRRLLLGDFFDFNPSVNFDGIIMNPPYVRQEDLVRDSLNSKEKIIKTLKADYSQYIEKRQNLYTYFFMKAHKLLKGNGRLVAICYDSWLYTRFGMAFKRFLDDHFQIETIIHFEERAFVNAGVGATVLQMTKLPCCLEAINKLPFRYARFREPADYDKKNVLFELNAKSCNELSGIGGDDLEFPKDFFVRLADLTKNDLRRGSSPQVNKYLLLDLPNFKETVPIIKEVKRIGGYKVLPTHLKYVVKIVEGQISNELQDYLKEVSAKVLESNRYRAAKKKIESGENWYEVGLVKPGTFIFNYYMRKDIKFIYNPYKYYASDNFYVFDTSIEPSLAIALLNSILTKIGVLKKSRTQGMGLRKIQLFEFREVPVINPNLLSKEVVFELKELGRKLIEAKDVEHKEILREIDQLVLCAYNKLVGSDISLDHARSILERNMGRHI